MTEIDIELGRNAGGVAIALEAPAEFAISLFSLKPPRQIQRLEPTAT